MRFAPFWTLCLIIGHALPSSAEIGFSKVDDPRVPIAVRAAAKSVLKFVTSVGPTVSVAQNDRSFIGSLGNPVNGWSKAQWMGCTLAGHTTCHISSQQGEGTGFVFRTATTVATNLHNVIAHVSRAYGEGPSTLTHQERVASLNGRPLFAGLVNSERRTIVDPSQASARLSFFPSIFSQLALGFARANTSEFRLSDYTELSVPALSLAPLQPATNLPEIGENLYLIGFPLATTNRAPLGHADSDGVEQTVSIGKRISMEAFRSVTGASIEERFSADFANNMILADFDCDHGNSGGPVVNERGEVVAIFMAMYGELPNRRCMSLRVQPHAEFEQLWSRLN